MRTEDGRLRTDVGEKIESFRELNVYKLAFELQQEVFALTRRFPNEELYSLSNQMRRASRSVGANIAEAWQKRRYPAHFVSKLSDADGEQAEMQHWMDTALSCEYISEEEHRQLLDRCKDIGKMLGKMMKEPRKWCNYQRTVDSGRKTEDRGRRTVDRGRRTVADSQRLSPLRILCSLSSVLCPLLSFHCALFTASCLFTAHRLPSSVHCRLSTVHRPLFVFPLSSVHRLLPFHCPPSTVLCPPSSDLTC